MPIETRRIYVKDYENHRTKSCIEIYLKCQWCNSGFWSRRKHTKFCHVNCRMLHHVAQKKK